MSHPKPANNRNSRRGEASEQEWNKALASISAGFAHDANNCLTGIFSMSDLCLTQIEPQNPLHESLTLIRESAGQASQLLQRLARLVYDTPGTRTYHDLNAVATESADIARRALPRSVEIAVILANGQLPIFADGVQLRRAVVHLLLHTASKLSGSGKVTVTTSIQDQLCLLTVACDPRLKRGRRIKSALAQDFAESHSGTLEGLELRLPLAS